MLKMGCRNYQTYWVLPGMKLVYNSPTNYQTVHSFEESRLRKIKGRG